jgi:hypothetical protein
VAICREVFVEGYTPMNIYIKNESFNDIEVVQHKNMRAT